MVHIYAALVAQRKTVLLSTPSANHIIFHIFTTALVYIMRTAGLSLFAVLTMMHGTIIDGHVICNTQLSPGIPSSNFQTRLSDIVSAFCKNSLEEVSSVSERIDDLVLDLHRIGVSQDMNECQSAFTAIISQCFDIGNPFGGELYTAIGNVYTIRSSSSVVYHSSSKFARAPAPKPGPATKSKPATGKPATGKPATGKPANGKPAASSLSAILPTPAKPSSTVSQTTIKIGPTKNCKQLDLMMQTYPKGNRLGRNVEEDRGTYIGSRVTTSGMGGILRRADDGDEDWNAPSGKDTQDNHDGSPKMGSACGIQFNALAYPNAKSMVS